MMGVDGGDEGQKGNSKGAQPLKTLPEELLQLIQMQSQPRFLDELAAAALLPHLTTRLFVHYEEVFADTCARWTAANDAGKQRNEVIEGFARILPFAPHLSTFLERYLQSTSPSSQPPNFSPRIQTLWEDTVARSEDSTVQLQRILLAVFRLLNVNKRNFSKGISKSTVQLLLQHGDGGVRYLAVRVFCRLFSASDSKLESMIEEYVGKSEAVIGDYDGESLDYGFLSIWEGKRLRCADDLRLETARPKLEDLELRSLSPLVVRYSGALIPRPHGQPLRNSVLIPTTTCAKNSETFANSLLSSSPVLLHGLAGSGKTSLVNDFARELGMEAQMVTLHLNEQTDAKMLIGMYTTGSIPGSFTWRPGVLTTAVKEGRWVLIEDLDRAPNEVISVILPLIERGELLIPSRGETIIAGSGFRLLATIRTSLNVTGIENPPALYMLGARLWRRVAVQMPSLDEFRQIIDGTYPILHKFLPGIISVYDRLCSLSQRPSFASRSRTSLGRPISPRDLLKWCRRMEATLTAAGSKNGDEPITEATKYDMFLEATDCFAGSLQTEESCKVVISAIAEEMHIDPQRVEHFVSSHVPRYEDTESEVKIGRVRLRKRASGRVSKRPKKSRPFANTTHAKRLLEQVGVAVKMSEPVLLVGETGIGKTTVVQQLADSLGFNLTAVNLSQQSEVGDLLGGFKPVNIRSLAIPLKEEFDDLFASTGISVSKNQRYVDMLGKCIAKSQWSKASKLWREAPRMFQKILSELSNKDAGQGRNVTEQPLKRRKTESRLQSLLDLKPRWDRFSQSLEQFDVQLSGGSKGFAFTFVEGNIVKAARNGDWVLLDEINLASPDTLESIADLLHSGSSTPSILLSETGEIERVKAHPNFRIFGAMNPATDVGKRDLPMGLRSRFTEIYVESPDRDLDDLLAVIKAYLKGTSSNDERAAHDVARLYLNTKRLADDKRLVDGANQVPHFSLRTLTRVLSYVTEIAPSYGLRRALYEGFAMGFLTLLNGESEKLLIPLINHHLLDSHGNPQALLAQTPRHPDDGREYVRFLNKKRDRQYWMLQGSEPRYEQPHYIITPFVERNMLNLVRATSTRRFPVLVQGPTSSGKTSMIEYLANFSGNKFVRINNHEHTDLQEYLGTYTSGSDGQLRFQEGLLVQALRQGHWIVLDELNLAPTDVLEALNRLLDDNRELLIPETQEIVRPHENFMLFATQNPPGLYGGRKTLSRAFRNRFLELHFDDIPEDELDFILEKRSQKVAPSDCRRIVSVYKELSRLRQSNRLFEQKDSFATLRDLFRWALRDADNREQLATNGYMLLAERVRNAEERLAVKQIIESVMKVNIDPAILYDAKMSTEIQSYNNTANIQGVVWTRAMRRLYVLVAHALRNNEPVLLVGETGCGKTTVCQMLAEAFGKRLHIVNAHQNTETGDLIGAQRPIRNRAAVLEQLKQDLVAALIPHIQDAIGLEIEDLLALYGTLPEQALDQIPLDLRQRISTSQIKAKSLFEWSDGSLVHAMKEAQFFLLDEISLADDSVLERLNSVLETQRTLLLAEKGIEDSFVRAADGFQFFATMNPGGDYGKRELSPALRNRFTEIWVPSLSEQEDILQIVEAKLQPELKKFSAPMVQFAEWFGQNYRSSATTSISVRDVLAWTTFMNDCQVFDPYFAVLHGAAMVYIDTLGANPAALLAISPDSILEERAKCVQSLSTFLQHDVGSIYSRSVDFRNNEDNITIGGFSVKKDSGTDFETSFAFDAPTTKLNGMRVIRALQVKKPILIEGSPGVGKTTLVAALARVCNRPLTRINLSEQTDLMDLFGSDIPVEGAEAGHFAWRDAPFLQAMQKGEWVLLDEMNLASQSVLEGLNACLDHRGEVYISELDQTFKRHADFSVFAAQNPHHQGGGRKGLPCSFVNRFTVVYADVFRHDDLELICRHNFPSMSPEIVTTIINFVTELEQEVVHQRRFGSQGGPWEFNLRDIIRWLQLLDSKAPLLGATVPSDFLNLIFRQRFRNHQDRLHIDRLRSDVFGFEMHSRHFFHNLSPSAYQVGIAYLDRDPLAQRSEFPAIDPVIHLAETESVMICVQQNLPCILVGSSGCGKTALLQHVAAIAGKSLIVFPLNADIDTMDLVGGFEQVDPQRAASAFLQELMFFLNKRLLLFLPFEVPDEVIRILETLNTNKVVEKSSLENIALILEDLHKRTSIDQYRALAETCLRFAATPSILESPRFEWVDGVLIKALEKGDWLVLDNANLCSASVLDRLNSLLEPDGFLSINEHCGPDGEPKLVKPHPDFRIFLTMDARFGELSRAMRNRAVEIFIEPLSIDTHKERINAYPTYESAMQRYQGVERVLEDPAMRIITDKMDLVKAVALDHLAWSDMPMLGRFVSSQKNPVHSASSHNSIYQTPSNQGFRAGIGGILDAVTRSNGLPGSFPDAQIIHPLQNSPLVSLALKSLNNENIYWLGTVYEVLIESSSASELLSRQAEGIENVKPSKLNRLQRSLIRGRVQTVGKDSTINIADFLTRTLKMIVEFAQNHIALVSSLRDEKRSIDTMLRYWWETYDLATSTAFEESTFQAHLAIGKDLLDGGVRIKRASGGLVTSFTRALKGDFESGFKLTTGLKMEPLWKRLRPMVISKASTLRTVLQLEQLADRFDTLRWKTSISVQELGSIMSNLVEAYRLVLSDDVDGAALVRTLDKEMNTLESGIGSEEDSVEPFFAADFETLRQYRFLAEMSASDASIMEDDVIILANHATASDMHLAVSSSGSWLLQSIEYLCGRAGEVRPLTDCFSVNILRRLHHIEDVDLKSLKLLETELPTIGKEVALSCKTLSRDQLGHLNKVLSRLVQDIVSTLNQSLPHASAGSDDYGLAGAKLALLAAEKDPTKSLQHSAVAWTQFAITAIGLYVPDRAFDPDKRQRLERERHIKTRDLLGNKLSALRQFEEHFSGQSSNLRCQLLEIDIEELGPPPEILQQIYRPEVSELEQLQGEFGNLLKIVVQEDIVLIIRQCTTGLELDSLQQIQLLQNNVSQIIRRLSERFRGYSDLTVPAVGMLRCLQVGLSLALLSSRTHKVERVAASAFAHVTPFLGGEEVAIKNNLLSAHPTQYLEWAATNAAVVGITQLTPEEREQLLMAFHECYDQWTKRLEADRADAESKSGLYRFKGSAEDEDEVDQEQFEELFPSYNESSKDTTNGVPPSDDVRGLAISLAQVHERMFFGTSAPSQGIKDLIRYTTQQIGKTRSSDSLDYQDNLTKMQLPGVLLCIDDAVDQFTSSDLVPAAYNFYIDANLPEARKLVTLVHSIQSRFRQLQTVDEISHMQPLADVLTACKELLAFKHTEPLAKMITKVEKVHTFVYEWQFGGWASRANSATLQYDELTKTIVDWRRLELSTWGKLFDMETKKCVDDAKSWWFVAYQVVVAAPLQISESPEQLRDYTQKLLKDLESYFSTAIQGQYSQRILLLKQLQAHIELAMKDFPLMRIIYTALANFISMYARYEAPVREHLKRGRASLEKAMRDVLLLASWKDTNIVALRDSAKRSHHKLFKIVRKFRALLAQPMDIIIKQGLPEVPTGHTETQTYVSQTNFPLVDMSALKLCAESVPNWSKRSKRFINISQTVSLMANASQIPELVVDGSTYLESFLANIVDSTAELQKSTPSILTEENKDTVKHLKARKRRLFADTLKDLRQMGIKYNLGVNALAKQDSLSITLASTEYLTRTAISDIEYYFHKAMDIAPRARDAVHQHSQDLSGAEVARSTGFLEGLLQTLIAQHNTLATAANGMNNFNTAIKLGQGLWAPEAYEIRVTENISSHERLLRWLPSILSVALDLVKTHSKLSKGDAQRITDHLSSSLGFYDNLSKQWEASASLPSRIVSTKQQDIENEIDDFTEQLRTDISEMCEVRPDLTFILDKVLSWTNIIVEPASDYPYGSTISELDGKLTTICDTILVAIEKHKIALSDLPTSAEDAGWFVKYDTSLINAMNSLHSVNILREMEQAFEMLRGLNLSDSQVSRAAGALFAVALPILQQYYNILQDTVIRYGELHRATCKTSYILAKTFIQIATQGFCTPSEQSDAQDGKTEKLEGGTGLGDGEGAEDISKDIQEDEDLDELAQEPNTGDREEMEDEQDAVDMADNDMEGEMGESGEKGEDEEGSGEEDNKDDIDEEAGDVDDLDPTAVDEKMWDGDGEKADKDQEGDDSKGKTDKDEQVAAQESQKEAEAGDEGSGDEEEAQGAEQGEEVTQDEVEKHDPYAQEGEALDLPEDMELEGDEGEDDVDGSDDGMKDLSDVENDTKDEEISHNGMEEDGAEDADQQENQHEEDEMDIVDLDEEDGNDGDETAEAGEKTEDPPEEQPSEEQEGLLRDRNDEAEADMENAVPSDVQGTGEDQDNATDDKTESASKAQREDGGTGGDSTEQKDTAAEDGEKGRQANGEAPRDSQDETHKNATAQPFKKLGDALERWHRQQAQIREPAAEKEKGQDQNTNPNDETTEFQHLQDENAEADDQALGTATEEQARALDESMAVDPESKDMPDQFQPDELEQDDIAKDDVMDLEDVSEAKDEEKTDAYEGRAGAMIKQAKEDRDEEMEELRSGVSEDLEEEVEEVDHQLESTHLDESTPLELRSAAEARQQWMHYESLTRDLSLSLTEQLRLILAPTLATKMRGDFRTGKRLNIKRIIPYIASQYKRDKIWMRRSVPSKRSYQIMLAVDDSKSMGESGSGSLAFETLVMVSKSLSMLEVGEICVVGFGEDVKVAHDFDTPFSSDSGPKIFQNFGFDQSRTDVTKLVRESIELFRAARTKASSSPANLWQLQLIISDGVCNSSEHEPIRRLLREAIEERIMMVFVIVDDLKNKKKGESVMDLKEAKFVKDEMTGVSNVKIERYLDTFPFQYYLIVSDVKELPGVLATLLRQWFAEVVDSSG